LNKSVESGEDLLGGLGPYERFGVLVPGGDPFADVGFEGLDAAVIGALEEVGGDVAEEPLDQVQPR
jgi:hypothetical protein